MNSLQIDQRQMVTEEKSILRWGGLAGILGGIIFIAVFIIVGVFVGDSPTTLDGWVTRFPDISAARTAENSLYLLVMILWVPAFIALYRSLRETSHASALFGSILGILGLTVLATGALPHVATSRIANIYFSPEATAVDQATVALMWQAIWGIFDALLFAGLVFLPIGLMLLGIAMFKTPRFGKRFGTFTVILGAIGIVAAPIFLINPASSIVAASVIGLIVFNLVLGSKLFRLSKTL